MLFILKGGGFFGTQRAARRVPIIFDFISNYLKKTLTVKRN
jgi:hypothetical protein